MIDSPTPTPTNSSYFHSHSYSDSERSDRLRPSDAPYRNGNGVEYIRLIIESEVRGWLGFQSGLLQKRREAAECAATPVSLSLGLVV